MRWLSPTQKPESSATVFSTGFVIVANRVFSIACVNLTFLQRQGHSKSLVSQMELQKQMELLKTAQESTFFCTQMCTRGKESHGRMGWIFKYPPETARKLQGHIKSNGSLVMSRHFWRVRVVYDQSQYRVQKVVNAPCEMDLSAAESGWLYADYKQLLFQLAYLSLCTLQKYLGCIIWCE